MQPKGVRPEVIAVSFDDEMIVISGAYPRKDPVTGQDLLTQGIISAMDFAASVDAEFHIIDEPRDNGPQTEGYYRG